MIHRKWSLLTGPAAILGGIVATVVVANFLFVKNVCSLSLSLSLSLSPVGFLHIFTEFWGPNQQLSG
ncbi:hypothetical protein RHMOL_Rhmol01G0220900 [Rhododendron molle]|uniref:Uncharacterized protein n=1 Tax=Rhododendron molle TaxID=49168 RepID=A0ACC0Q4R0_RHOML|nr:hypothetical protein RHMOL_Rhmol01G0220900 [Rhododendron molle]